MLIGGVTWLERRQSISVGHVNGRSARDRPYPAPDVRMSAVAVLEWKCGDLLEERKLVTWEGSGSHDYGSRELAVLTATSLICVFWHAECCPDVRNGSRWVEIGVFRMCNLGAEVLIGYSQFWHEECRVLSVSQRCHVLSVSPRCHGEYSLSWASHRLNHGSHDLWPFCGISTLSAHFFHSSQFTVHTDHVTVHSYPHTACTACSSPSLSY